MVMDSNVVTQVMEENLVVAVAIGVIAGWLVGHFVRGIGFGIFGDVVVGIGGAIIGGRLLPELNIRPGAEFASAMINAIAGALLFLFGIGILRAAIGRGPSWREHEWRWL